MFRPAASGHRCQMDSDVESTSLIGNLLNIQYLRWNTKESAQRSCEPTSANAFPRRVSAKRWKQEIEGGGERGKLRTHCNTRAYNTIQGGYTYPTTTQLESRELYNREP